LLKNGEDWGKLIVAKGFKKLPKVQNIAQSGHTACLLLISTVFFALQQEMYVLTFEPTPKTHIF